MMQSVFLVVQFGSHAVIGRKRKRHDCATERVTIYYTYCMMQKSMTQSKS